MSRYSEQLDRAGCSVKAVDRGFELSAEETARNDGESHRQFQQIGGVEQG